MPCLSRREFRYDPIARQTIIHHGDRRTRSVGGSERRIPLAQRIIFEMHVCCLLCQNNCRKLRNLGTNEDWCCARANDICHASPVCFYRNNRHQFIIGRSRCSARQRRDSPAARWNFSTGPERITQTSTTRLITIDFECLFNIFKTYERWK